MSEKSKVICVHIEVTLNDDGSVAGGKTFTSWEGSIQASHEIGPVKHSEADVMDTDEHLNLALGTLFDRSLLDLERRPR